MIERIKTVLSVKNLSSSQLAKEIGVQRSGISHILSGRNKPSLDFVLKLLNHFSDISESWLLTGEGEMMKLNTFQTSNENKFENPEKENNQIDKSSTNVDEQKSIEITKAENIENIKTVQSSDIEKLDQLMENEKLKEITKVEIVKIITVYSDNTFEVLSPKK